MAVFRVEKTRDFRSRGRIQSDRTFVEAVETRFAMRSQQRS